MYHIIPFVQVLSFIIWTFFELCCMQLDSLEHVFHTSYITWNWFREVTQIFLQWITIFQCQQKCAITCCIKRTSSNCLKIKKLIWMESFHGSMPSLQSFMLEYSCSSHSPLNHSLYEHCNSNHTLFWVWHLNLCSICMSLMTRYYSHCFLVSSHLPQRCKGFVCQQRKANNFF